MDLDFGQQLNRPLQILVFGIRGVGKTTLIEQLREISAHIFGQDAHETGEDEIDVKSSTSEKLMFQEATMFPFPSFERLAIHRSDAFILTYDVGDHMSLEYVYSFLAIIKQVKGQNAPIFVVGNRTYEYNSLSVDDTEIYDFNKNLDYAHIQVCALNGDGTKDLFSCMLGRLSQHFVLTTGNYSEQEKKQSLRKRISDYFRKKLMNTN